MRLGPLILPKVMTGLCNLIKLKEIQPGQKILYFHNKKTKKSPHVYNSSGQTIFFLRSFGSFSLIGSLLLQLTFNHHYFSYRMPFWGYDITNLWF